MILAYNPSCYAKAAYELKKRSPFMITKFRDTPARRAGQIRGLVIEHHVTQWFKIHYPDRFEEADNFRQWTEMCAHDFKLKIGFESLLVDVSGPKKDGSFGSYTQKPKKGVDAHILCGPISFTSWDRVDFKQGFKIKGVVMPTDYQPTISEEHILDLFDWIKMNEL